MSTRMPFLSLTGGAPHPASSRPVVDVHAHHFPSGLRVPAACANDPRWPSLLVDDDLTGRIMRGPEVFRQVKRALWDVPTRLAELAAAGINLQVISPVPVTLFVLGRPAARDPLPPRPERPAR